MKPIEIFGGYAMAFEEAVRTDDWSVVAPFFAEDVVYETIGPEPFAGRREGRQAVLAYLKESLDRFDRRFDVREDPGFLEEPRLSDNSVWIHWRVTYRVEGAPPLDLVGEETAVMEGDRICRLEDRFTDEMASTLQAWMGEHEAKLKPPASG